MDDLLREFLTETAESLDAVDRELVRFEKEPNDTKSLDTIFRLVHTIKGTCGFLGLPRLAALTHAAETLLGGFRNGSAVTVEAVNLILASIDRIKALLDALERNGIEPDGNDRDLIGELEALDKDWENPSPAPERTSRLPAPMIEREPNEHPGPGSSAVRSFRTIASQAARTKSLPVRTRRLQHPLGTAWIGRHQRGSNGNHRCRAFPAACLR